MLTGKDIKPCKSNVSFKATPTKKNKVNNLNLKLIMGDSQKSILQLQQKLYRKSEENRLNSAQLEKMGNALKALQTQLDALQQSPWSPSPHNRSSTREKV